MVDCVGGDGEDGALREAVVADGDAGPGGDDAGEAEGGGGVDAEGFGDHVVETAGVSSAWRSQRFRLPGELAWRRLLRQILHHVVFRHIDPIRNCFV